MKHNLPILTLCVAAAAMAAQVIPGAAGWLQYDRGAVAGGESWRWLTGHLTHFGGNHMAWDLVVFVALGAVCEGESRLRMAMALVLAALAVSAGLWWVQPEFVYYRGLSGLDCALAGVLGANLVRCPQRLPRLMGALMLTFLGAKCIYELATADTLFATGTGYVPVPLAHLVGFGMGVLSAISWRSDRQRMVNGAAHRWNRSSRRCVCAPLQPETIMVSLSGDNRTNGNAG